MERDLRMRNRVISQMEAILTFAKKINENTTENAIRPRLTDLIKYHDHFNETEIALEEFPEYDTVATKINAMYYETRTLLEDALCQITGIKESKGKSADDLNETLESFVVQQRTFYESLNATSSVPLPKINVEPFSGDYRMWPSFRDLYVNAIHEHPKLKGAQKLQQLKSLLRGEAAGLIRHITTTDQNYAEAWEKLQKRYDKPKPIVSTLIQTFLDQKVCKTTNYKELRRLYDQSDEIVRALRSLGQQQEGRCPWLIHLLLQKVDSDTQQLWARESVANLYPTFEDFLAFLNLRCDSLESCNIHAPRVQSTSRAKLFLTTESKSSSVSGTCYACNGDHLMYKCPSFRNKTLESRRALAAEKGLCYNCLRKGHTTSRCLSKSSCMICRRRHHSLLHAEIAENTVLPKIRQAMFVEQANSDMTIKTSPSNETKSQLVKINTDQSPNANISKITNRQCSPVNETLNNYLIADIDNGISTSSRWIVLPTAVVDVQSNSGRTIQARALLDSGSQCAFITESMTKRLGLTRKKSNLKIIGLASSPVGSTRGTTTLSLQSRYNSNYKITITAQIVKTISSTLPEHTFRPQSHEKLKEIQLADSKFNEARPVDLLIGAEHFFEIVGKHKVNVPGLPPLYQSEFGWLVAGNIEANQPEEYIHRGLTVTTIQIEQEDLNELLKRFWEVEEVPTPLKVVDDDYCENLYSRTTIKTKDRRFQVRLPFLAERTSLGNSYTNAKCRLLAMENKFKRNEEFKQLYQQFMKEYRELNHMKKVTWAQIPQEDDQRYFMPHHGILKENSSTTKLRVVFDASCKTTQSVSLNEILNVGPKIQNDLFWILLRFRMHQIAFVADIEKMYRQILVNETDRNYQLILWRDDPSSKIDIYQLSTITYGVNCSPYLAVRTIQQIAQENALTHPAASNVILNDFYMDDLLSGADTEEEALKLKGEVTRLLSQHGFDLRKWRSNSSQLLKSFTEEEISTKSKLIEENPSTSILGIIWNAETDMFSFRTKLSSNREWTKRKILSEISKIYDPVGWLVPTVIIFKILIQRLWVARVDWDTPLPAEINNEFQSVYSGLLALNQISIGRRYHKFAGSLLENIQIHAFCDASEKAYGAVVYIRAGGRDGTISTQMIAAKGKVAPIKQICLPRLELCGAYILAKVVKLIKKFMFPERQVEVHAWCDSSVVLHWLNDIPRRWKSFIGNRTSYILDVIPTPQWHYVPTKQNPADLISRGIHPNNLHQTKLWWKGPTWLKQPPSTWPANLKSIKPWDSQALELRVQSLHCTSLPSALLIIDKLITKWSSYLKIKRTLVYVLRFGRSSTKPRSIMQGPIQLHELKQAENIILRSIQLQAFREEFTSIQKGEEIKSKSKLKSLNIFIDEGGILRVGGRLQNSNLRYDSQHPIILPRGHPVNELILKEIHHALLHGGLSLTLSTLRSRFWMIDARNSVKRFIRTCVTCIRYRAATSSPRMGDLPLERVTAHRPFLNSGLDYAGPIYIKSSKLRKAPITKAYIAVFVCLAVKAVHLELVSSLDTDSFIAALRRFIARRGIPKLIWCDNGSNFVSGNSEIKLLNKQLRQQQNSNNTLQFCLQNNIEFRFNPPSGPHFGGLWEATVKSVKFHMRRVMGNSNYTYESLNTMMTQIEAILNSRPLCRLSDDANDLQALTPGHFLIGEQLISFPEPSLEHLSDNKINVWQNIQKRVQGFWKQWHKDYLCTLNQRLKWHHQSSPYNVNDVVILKEPNLPPTQWLLGRIITTYPGKDGITRVVKIKTKNSELIRPVVKLVKLPVNSTKDITPEIHH